MRPVTIDHCVIHVTDWARSNHFYAAVLGAEVVPRQKGFAYKIGTFLLNCHGPGVTAKALARVPVAPGGSDLCFEWPGPLDEAIAHLTAQGIAIELGPVETNGLKGRGLSVYFRDPDGSLLEFITYLRA
jgi:catechol 2,3-dioxygenase-like lactoylglutathione lyase family enzyme